MVAEVTPRTTPSNTGANAVAVFNVAASLFSAHKSGSSNRAIARHNAESLLLDNRKRELNNIRTSISMVHEAQGAVADVTSQANAAGVAGSSTALQIKGGISTQIGLEASNMNTQDLLDRGILTANQAALDEQAKANKLQSYINGFSTVLMAGQALGLNGAALSSFTAAVSAGGQAIYALAAANPVIAAALIAMALLGEDETKRIGRDLDDKVGVSAIKKNPFGIAGAVVKDISDGAEGLLVDGVDSALGAISGLFGRDKNVPAEPWDDEKASNAADNSLADVSRLFGGF